MYVNDLPREPNCAQRVVDVVFIHVYVSCAFKVLLCPAETPIFILTTDQKLADTDADSDEVTVVSCPTDTEYVDPGER